MSRDLLDTNIGEALWGHKYLIGVSTIVAVLLGVVFTSPYFVSPLYESSLRMYPSLTISAGAYDEYEPRIGSEEEVRNHLEFLRSSAVEDSLIDKFELVSRYNIDTNRLGWQNKLIRKLDKRLTIDRTIYNSIEVSVKDEDPETAAEMAAYIRNAADNLRKYRFRENYRKGWENARDNYYEQRALLRALEDSIEEVRLQKYDRDIELKRREMEGIKDRVEILHDRISDMRNEYGIYDLGEQINLLYEQLVEAKSKYRRDSGRLTSYMKSENNVHDTVIMNARARLEGSRESYKSLSASLSELTRANMRYSRLVNLLEIEEEHLADAQKSYEARKRDFDRQASDFEMNNLYKSFAGEFEVLQDLRKRYVRARNDYEQEFVDSYLISPTRANYEAVYPRRTLASSFSGGLVFFLTAAFAIRRYHYYADSQ